MEKETSEAPLTLPAEAMRALGYRVVDMLVAHAETLPTRPVSGVAPRAEVETKLWEPLPEEGTSPEALLEQLQRDVFAHVSHVDHPRFFAYIPGPGNFVSVMAEALAAGFNVFAGTWIGAAGPAMLELVTVDWLRQLCEMPEGAGGLFVSGGSVANLTALGAARHVKLGDRKEGATAYCSNQTHSAVARALHVLGFAPDQLRTLPADADFRLDLDTLRQAVTDDRAAGKKPFCVVATAGTTNTGAVDPLAPLADFCEEENLWFHVDAAYGGAAMLCDEGRTLLHGLGRADSIALDPHKWLFQPFEIGCVLTRDPRHLYDAYHVLPEYLLDTQLGAAQVNFSDYGVQLTRSFRALKVWLSFKTFGVAAFREAVTRGFRQAEASERMLATMPDWEITTPARLGIVTFRYAPPHTAPADLDALNLALVERLRIEGLAMLSTTVLHGRTVLRLCPINPRTTEDDLRRTLERLDELARS